MSDRYIEKSFLYFIALSLLLHAAALTGMYFLPEQKHEVTPEPFMVDLDAIPDLHQMPNIKQDVKRFAERRSRVARERSPRGERERDISAPSRLIPRSAQPVLPQPRREAVLPAPEGVIPRSSKLPELAKLYPSASGLARLEETYRKKYDTEIEEGATRFLNTDDIQFGSFLRRFETAVYAVWRYPSEAARAGIQGVTPVRITFNRKGEIEKIQLLQSSGSQILDDEVFRALHAIGPVGSFPKTYAKDQFNLIAFFQYGLIGGSIRGSIR